MFETFQDKKLNKHLVYVNIFKNVILISKFLIIYCVCLF
jgi:hypothetical protein